MSYLVRRNGIFHYRRHVPSDLQPLVGKSWWKISLKTGSQREAEGKARNHAVTHDQVIAHFRGLSDRERLAKLEPALDAQLARGQFQQLDAHGLSALDLAMKVAYEQYAEAQKRLGLLAQAERWQIENAGGLDAYLASAAEDAERTEDARSADPVEMEVRLRRLEPKAAIIRKLGIDRHGAVLATTVPHEKNPRVSLAVESWLKDRQQGQSSAARHRVAMKRFVELNGDVTVQQINKAMVKSYGAAIANLADQRCLPTKLRGGMKDGERDGHPLPRVSAKTVERHLISLRAFLTWCEEQDFVESNVATGVRPPKDLRPKADKRRAFERAELKAFLSRVVEEEGADSDKAWFVRLCAYTGIRLEEAAQLARKNVRQLDGIWIIDIDDLDGRNLKSHTSVKKVPLHEVIRDDFVSWVQKGTGDRVFSSFRPYSGRFVNKLSGDFARLMDRAGLSDPRLTFHSLRHTLKKEMNDARVDPDMRRQILGHAPKSAHDGYSGASLKALADELGKVPALF